MQIALLQVGQETHLYTPVNGTSCGSVVAQGWNGFESTFMIVERQAYLFQVVLTLHTPCGPTS